MNHCLFPRAVNIALLPELMNVHSKGMWIEFGNKCLTKENIRKISIFKVEVLIAIVKKSVPRVPTWLILVSTKDLRPIS
jgi:hypothetical protein